MKVKEAAKAELEGALEEHRELMAVASKELMMTLKYIRSLHGECEWLGLA